MLFVGERMTGVDECWLAVADDAVRLDGDGSRTAADDDDESGSSCRWPSRALS